MAAVATPLELVRQFVANFERKQRNLIKRKSKLDAYRDKLSKGDKLNEEQRKAVDSYGGVLQSITVVQEFITQSKELLEDMERSVKQEESQLALAHERHTLSFLHTHVCLMRLLNALDIHPVRIAVAKASSENHLKLLDILRNLVTAPIIDNWPGTSAAALSDAPSFLQQQPSLNAVADHINNFVLGRPIVIPLPNDYDGPHKKFTYKDARVLCFRLLATPSVQRSMGLPSRPASVVSSLQEERTADVPEREVDPTKLSSLDPPLKHTQIAATTTESNPTLLQQDASELAEPTVPNIGVLDQVIKPLGGTFNFLQASKVVPDSVMMQSPNQAEVLPTIPAPNGVPDHSHYDSHLPTQNMEHSPVAAEKCYTPVAQHNPPSNYSIPVEPQLELSAHDDQGLLDEQTTNQMHHEDDTQASVPVSSKPVSYADLVRRQGYSRPVTHTQPITNELRKQESYNTETDTATEATPNEYHSAPVNIQGNRGRGGSARGRGQGEFRGGWTRGPNRGGFGGAQRRGGSRGGRYESGSGRGGAPYRGMSTGIAQPTY